MVISSQDNIQHKLNQNTFFYTLVISKFHKVPEMVFESSVFLIGVKCRRKYSTGDETFICFQIFPLFSHVILCMFETFIIFFTFPCKISNGKFTSSYVLHMDVQNLKTVHYQL